MKLIVTDCEESQRNYPVEWVVECPFEKLLDITEQELLFFKEHIMKAFKQFCVGRIDLTFIED
mgnify:CR=1 FL=1